MNATLDIKKLAEEHLYDVPSLQIEVPNLQETNILAFEKPSFALIENNKKKIQKIKEFSEFKEFKIIDLEFLTMRNKNGMPRFSVFSLNEENCSLTAEVTFPIDSISYHVDYRYSWHSKYVASKFKDVFLKLARKAINKGFAASAREIRCSIVSNFSGFVPTESRNRIKECREKFTEIIIIAEADNWIDEEKITSFPKNPDPLVIGIKNEIAYLIDTFDMTLLEKYISKEFV